jgi:hypothetical protein
VENYQKTLLQQIWNSRNWIDYSWRKAADNPSFPNFILLNDLHKINSYPATVLSRHFSETHGVSQLKIADLVTGYLSEALLNVTISCHYPFFSKGCDMEGVSKPKMKQGPQWSFH